MTSSIFLCAENLGVQLEEYIKQFDGKVKLFRNTERLGLIMTRTLGAKYASGEVIVFLDAHCELKIQVIQGQVKYSYLTCIFTHESHPDSPHNRGLELGYNLTIFSVINYRNYHIVFEILVMYA